MNEIPVMHFTKIEAPVINNTPETVITQTPPVQQQPIPTPTVVDNTQPVVCIIDKLKADIEKASVLGKINFSNVLDYIKNMAPRKPISTDEGIRHQVALYRSLTTVINNLDSDFNLVYGSILQLFNEHKDGAFHETRVFRFMDNITLPDNDRKSFQRLLNLVKLTADPKGRELTLKQINLDSALEFISENGRQKIMKFYNKH